MDTYVGRLTALAQIRETRTLAKNHANMQGNPAQQPYDLKDTLTHDNDKLHD